MFSEIYSDFSHMHLKYHLEGNVEKEKTEKWEETKYLT